MSNTPIPENLTNLCEIAGLVGLDGNFKPLIDAFNAARDRILKCGNKDARRLMFNNNPPQHLSFAYQAQLIEDSMYAHRLTKAVDVTEWYKIYREEERSEPENTEFTMFDKMWKTINGGDNCVPMLLADAPTSKLPIILLLRKSFALATATITQKVREEMDALPTLEPQSP